MTSVLEKRGSRPLGVRDTTHLRHSRDPTPTVTDKGSENDVCGTQIAVLESGHRRSGKNEVHTRPLVVVVTVDPRTMLKIESLGWSRDYPDVKVFYGPVK